jgi:hypothetical protein
MTIARAQIRRWEEESALVDFIMGCTFGEIGELARLGGAAQKTGELTEYIKLAEFVADIRKRKETAA